MHFSYDSDILILGASFLKWHSPITGLSHSTDTNLSESNVNLWLHEYIYSDIHSTLIFIIVDAVMGQKYPSKCER